MARPTVCKLTGCERKRFQLRTTCLFHIREAERARKAEREAKKKARRLNSKGYEESQRKGLKKKLDIVFSKLIRSKGRCDRCGMADYSKLQTSHIYTRANLAVRWDELNADCFCAGCHFWWHQNPVEGVMWQMENKPQEKRELLRARANAVKQWQVSELKQLLSDLTDKLSHLPPP